MPNELTNESFIKNYDMNKKYRLKPKAIQPLSMLSLIPLAACQHTPTDIQLSTTLIDENLDAATVIGSVTTTDKDQDDTHTYSVSDDRFEIVDGELLLKAGQSLDHEDIQGTGTDATIDVDITSTDSDGRTYTETFTITVGDVNETPNDITLGDSFITENVMSAIVGTLTTADVDDGDTHTYTVSDDRFEVVGGELKLKEGISLNHETADSIDVDVTTTDSGGLAYTETFAVSVSDVNEAPTDLTLDNTSIVEDDTGAVVGTLAVTDDDEGDTHTYIVSDDRFEVVDGQLKLKDGISLDYETAPSVSVDITATDSNGLSYTETFELTVNDVLEGFTISGINAGDESGTSVSSAGDVNGDGIDDFIISAPWAGSDDSFEAGETYVVFGTNSGFDAALNLSDLDGSNGFVVEGGNAHDNAGFSMSGVGDVNGDGIDDIIIGAPWGESSTSEYGESYVIFGSGTGFNARIDLSDLDGTNGFAINGFKSAGYAVAGTGDVNGDGIDDILMSAPYSNEYENGINGQSFVIFGSDQDFDANFDLKSLDGSNGFALKGDMHYYMSGSSVSNAGDVNGDGFDDIIIGASQADYGAGRSYVVFGSDQDFIATVDLETLDGNNGFMLSANIEDGYSGWSVSGAGDINGDGIDDIIIDSRYGNDPYGESYVVFGSNAGFDANFDLSSLDGSNGFTIRYDSSNTTSSSAGDINGDGIDDIIIGSPNSNESYIIFGSDQGFSASFDISDLDGSNGFVLRGIDSNDESGTSVSAAGDVNGDGIDDLIIGAPDPSIYGHGSSIGYLNDNTAGESYVVFGHAGDWDASYDLADLPNSAPDYLELDNNTVAANIYGAVVGGLTTYDATDGDGFTYEISDDRFEVVDGQLKLKNSISLEGVLGDSIAVDITVTDPDGLTLTESFSLSVTDTLQGFTIINSDADIYGGFSVSSAGDINGDGLDDLVIGAYRAEPDGNYSTGTSYVVFSSGEDIAATFDLSTLDGINGFKINGLYASEENGYSVSGAGDVNGDGIDDLIIGANAGNSNYVIFGSTDAFSSQFDLSTLDGSNGFIIAGGGYSVSSAGDINNDGFDDVVVSAYYSDRNHPDNTGYSYVVYGSDQPFDASIHVSSLDGSNGFILSGGVRSFIGGMSVSNAGDINGDGIDDIIIGSPEGYVPENYWSGISYVVFGSDAGFSADVNLDALDGTNGFVITGIDERDKSGTSVSSAGDINGDGIDDLIVGANYADANGNALAGASYVIFGADTGFDASFDLSTLDGNNGFVVGGIDAGDMSGWSVSSAGDINGDGFDDLIIGSSRADANGVINAGESYVIFGTDSGFDATFNLTNLDGSNGFAINGISSSDYSGTSVSGAGDVNGDGYDDIIIGAYGADINGVQSTGASYVIFGHGGEWGSSYDLADLPNSAPVDLMLDNNTIATNTLGAIVGGFGVDDATNNGGFTYIVSDDRFEVLDNQLKLKADQNLDSDEDETITLDVTVSDKDGLSYSESFTLTTTGALSGITITGLAASNWNGSTVSDAGDVNGDGVDDFIIGAPITDANGNFASGASYVIFGNANGLPSTIDIGDLDGSNGFALTGVSGGDYSGYSVASAGDVNGDGIADLIIGASSVDVGDNRSVGASYVVYGSDAGFGEEVVLNSLDGTNGFIVNGLNANDNLGISVSSAGDVNNDGIDDFIIGANSRGNDSGKAYVIFGSLSGFDANFDLTSLDGTNGFIVTSPNIGPNMYPMEIGVYVSNAGDFNGDGIDDLLIGSRVGHTYIVYGSDSGYSSIIDPMSLSGSDGVIVYHSDGYGHGYSVSGAGDVNGDGIDDIIIGAYTAGGLLTGKSYVVFGSDQGFSTNIDLATLNGTNGFAISGIDADDLSGYSVSGAGDVNGDGFDDLIIGAYRADPNGEYSSGESYIVFGTDLGFDAAFDLANLDGPNGFAIYGTAANENSGYSVSGAGDVNGDGFDDLIIGANASPDEDSTTGNSYVVFGHGGDWDANYDLADMNSNHVDGTTGDDMLVSTNVDNVMTGYDGDDVFVFDEAWGDDTITDFEDGIDLLDLTDSSLSFSDLTISVSGDDTIVDDGNGNSITLLGIASSDVTIDDFIF